MNVKLIAHSGLSHEFLADFWDGVRQDFGVLTDTPAGAAVALTAIRTCYSANKPSEILALEGEKYFGNDATDGEGGNESDRLFRHIIRSKHTSTLEHITYTFAIEGVSRSLLAQLTRHRVGFSFSVQSQRYVKFGSNDKSGGFDYVTPPSVIDNANVDEDGDTALKEYTQWMEATQSMYDAMRRYGISAEDARYVLPNAAACNLVMTVNLRALLEFYSKRRPGNGAQWEIAALSERLREEVVKVDAWVAPFFEEVSAP